MAAAKTKAKSTKAKGAKGGGLKGKFILVLAVLAGMVFLPTSMILFIGMMPTLSAFFVGSSRAKVRISTIAAVNLLGCMPFVIKLWQGENNFDSSVAILTTPLTIVIIYGAAMMGYVLDWAVTGVVSAYMYQKAERKVKSIEKRQAALEEVWGKEVGGAAVIKKPPVPEDGGQN